MAKILLLAAVIFIVGFITSCNKKSDNPDPPGGNKKMDQLVIDRNFDWATTKDVAFNIIARDNMDKPLSNVRIKIFTANPDSGGVYMYGGVTDASGVWSSTQPVPTYLKYIYVANDYVGLIREQRVAVQGNTIDCIFGGLAPNPVSLKSSGGGSVKSTTATKWVYMSSYTTGSTGGVPANLEPVNDPVSQTLLNDLNATLPERKSVPVYHPEFLASTVPNNLVLLEECDVWITYITEGAGWNNSFGFFVFNSSQPPTSADKIDTVKLIFPNLSNTGSGGGLNPGNKVKLGRFPAGKSIGFVVVPHGWNGNGVYIPPTNPYIIYSIPAFNPEPDNLKKHMLILRDATRLQFLFSFEDWRRDDSPCDHDFNDGILYIKANPVSAVNTEGMPPIVTTQPDTDLDGVPDVFDDYPNDNTKAYDNWYPGKTGYSSLAFEDLWPGKGDYDFNDLVVSYRFNQITNAQNKAVQVKATLITEAMGASLRNAFAFQMAATPNQVLKVAGYDLKHNVVTLSANGTEAGQSKAVIVAYDDAYDRLPPPGIGVGSNTEKGAPYITPDTMRLTIDFIAGGISLAQAGTPPYNPFIILNGNRNKEVHLPDKPPTDLVNGADFGTYDDDSQPASNRFYKTKTNLPWAINIAQKFSYVFERQAINTGYLKFNQWAETAGASFPDWHNNTASGYRDNTMIYTH